MPFGEGTLDPIQPSGEDAYDPDNTFHLNQNILPSGRPEKPRISAKP